MLGSFLFLSLFWTVNQTFVQVERPRTNDGRVFRDPFGDSDANEDLKSKDMENDEFSDEAEDFSIIFEDSDFTKDFDETESEVREDSPDLNFQLEEPKQENRQKLIQPPQRVDDFQEDFQTDEESSDASELIFEFPFEDGPSGPVSQQVFRKKMSAMIAPKGSWFLSLRPGIAYSLNKRPFQLGFEMEGSYRLLEKLDLNLLVGYRFLKDRIFGGIFMPSWNFHLTKDAESRVDLRLGLGLGWYLQGVRGSDFQFGQFPIRMDSQLAYYVYPKLALLLNVGFEAFVFRVDTGGVATNQISEEGGMPFQGLAGFGLRFEFW
jgi:hypothetical protein